MGAKPGQACNAVIICLCRLRNHSALGQALSVTRVHRNLIYWISWWYAACKYLLYYYTQRSRLNPATALASFATLSISCVLLTFVKTNWDRHLAGNECVKYNIIILHSMLVNVELSVLLCYFVMLSWSATYGIYIDQTRIACVIT